MQVAALPLDVSSQILERLARAPCARLGLHGGHVCLQHLQIVQFSEHVLRALDRADVRGRLLQTAVGRELQPVTQLLGRDPDRVKPLGRVHVTRVSHRIEQPPRSGQQARGQRLAPRFRDRLVQRPSDRGKPSIQLVCIDALEPLDHQLAARIALLHHARSNVLDCIARDVGRPRQLIQKLNRDIQLADGAQSAGHTSDLLTSLARLASGEASGQNRNRLAQAPGRHPGLVDAGIVAADRRGDVPVEGTGQPL